MYFQKYTCELEGRIAADNFRKYPPQSALRRYVAPNQPRKSMVLNINERGEGEIEGWETSRKFTHRRRSRGSSPIPRRGKGGQTRTASRNDPRSNVWEGGVLMGLEYAWRMWESRKLRQ